MRIANTITQIINGLLVVGENQARKGEFLIARSVQGLRAIRTLRCRADGQFRLRWSSRQKTKGGKSASGKYLTCLAPQPASSAAARGIRRSG